MVWVNLLLKITVKMGGPIPVLPFPFKYYIKSPSKVDGWGFAWWMRGQSLPPSKNFTTDHSPHYLGNFNSIPDR